jgi:hypothetical protein
MLPISLSDAELAEVLALAAGVPIDRRGAFLQAVADALSQYPEDARDVGLIHEAAEMQKPRPMPPPPRPPRPPAPPPWRV